MNTKLIKQLPLIVLPFFLLVSCAQQLPGLPPVVPVQSQQAAGIAVCNHDFTSSQQSIQPVYTERETNSVVKGSTLEELLSALQATSDFRGQGNTRWTVGWTFDLQRDAFDCRIANVKTSAEVNYHFPIWSEQLVAPNRILAAQWDAYSDALRAHHCRHGKTGIDASIEVAARLRRISPSVSCETVKQEADDLARSVVSVYKLVESEFTPPVISDYLGQ